VSFEIMYKNVGKRTLDVFLASFAFLILWPLLVTLAIAIKVFDPGPVIFRQKRIGRNGEIFQFYKFRSMPVDTGDVSSDKLGEIKITWVGRLIRRTNLDELPQLWNILRGDMSIVGPRPSLITQVELVAIRKLNGAVHCRPGLTGLAQVSSFDGMTVAEKAEFDGIYASKVSFVIDISIILKTFLYLLKPPPKY